MKRNFQFSTKRLFVIVAGVAIALCLTLFVLRFIHQVRVEQIVLAELEAYAPQIVQRDGVPTIVLSGTQDKLLVIDQKEVVLLLGVPRKNSVLLKHCFITHDAKVILSEHELLRRRLNFEECEFGQD